MVHHFKIYCILYTTHNLSQLVGEGGANFFHAMKFVPPKDLGSIVLSTLFIENTNHSNTNHWNQQHLALFIDKHVCPFYLYHSKNILEHIFNIKMCGKRACIHEFNVTQ